MNTKTQISLLSILSATLLIFGISGLSLADDTDIYLGGGSLSGNSIPNILYVIDTSGSMAWDTMDVAHGHDNLRGNTFDPTTPDLTIYPSATYRVYNGYCTQGKYYWESLSDYNNGKFPDCKGNTNRFIDAAALHCADAVSALSNTSTTGLYQGRLAQDSSGWTTFTSGDHTSNVECKNDYGVHGQNGTTTNLYPAKNSGWTNIDNPGSTSLDWNSKGGDYVLFNANYLNWRQTDRMTTIMDVYIDLLTGIVNSGAKMNISLMRYDSNSNGGYFIMPHQELTAANLQTYIDSVLALRPNGGTPLTETFYEAYRFYNGLSATYGASSHPGTNPLSMYSSGTTYTSPVTNQCQKNFVIMLTDGVPTSDTGANSAISSLVPGSCWGDGGCLDDLAGYMFDADCSATHSGKQNVITYTIGFGSDVAVPGSSADTLLKNTATAGGGESFLATTSDEVINSLAKIILDVKRVVSVFTAPSVSINAYNRNFHSDELYYALFQPEAGPIWPGNIKTYKMDPTTNTIVDVNGNPVVDPATGTIKPSAVSFWTDVNALPAGITADGGDISLGGAASKLTTSRNTYTYTGSTAPNNENLTAPANALRETNTAITTTMLGVPSMTAAERTDTLKWARGIDVKDANGNGIVTDARKSMGDPLHSQPVVVNYGPATNDLVMYASTNEGYLHAIDIKAQGTELFAFMPQELLANIYPRMNNGSLANHIYGLDGPISLWYNDVNNDGILYSSSTTLQPGEFVYLYQGMRRGGNHYYALDITNHASPKLMWEITGGAGGTTGFSELGQTWSTMKKAKVKINGTDRDVLIFGGGYDTTQDTADNLHTADTIGRSIYMVDATTGAKVWQAGPPGTAPERASNNPDLVLTGMTNAFPSDIVIIDTNRDGYQDTMYAADIGGHIWRFDIDNDNNTGAADLVQGGIIASLYGSTKEENRRFYNTPEVALSVDSSYFAIAIGSGHRAVPKNQTVHDAFFLIKDPYVMNPPPKDGSGIINYKYVDTNSDGVGDAVIDCCDANLSTATTPAPRIDLFDATNNILGSNVGDTLLDGTTVNSTNKGDATTSFNNSHGWFIWLHDLDPVTHAATYVGEKVTAEATAIQGQLDFVTFTPVETASSTVCKPNMGRGRIYSVYMGNATPVHSPGTIADPRVISEPPGLPGRVQNIIGTSSWVNCTGLNCGPPEGSLSPHKTGWDMVPDTVLTPSP